MRYYRLRSPRLGVVRGHPIAFAEDPEAIVRAEPCRSVAQGRRPLSMSGLPIWCTQLAAQHRSHFGRFSQHPMWRVAVQVRVLERDLEDVQPQLEPDSTMACVKSDSQSNNLFSGIADYYER